MSYLNLKSRIQMRFKREIIHRLGIISDQKFYLDSYMVAQRHDGVVRHGVYSESIDSTYILPAKNEFVRNCYPKRYVYGIDSAYIDNLSGFVYDRKGQFIAESSAWNHLRLFYAWAKPSLKKPKSIINERCIFLANNGYYHWLIEDLPVFIAALEMYPNATVVVPEHSASYVETVIKSLDRKVIKIDSPVIIKDLIMVGKTAGQGSPYMGLTPHPKDVSVLRSYFSKYMQERKVEQSSQLYLSREGYPRSPQNEISIQESMKDKGFYIFNAKNNMSLFDQISHFYNSNEIIGVHGAALANIVWCRPNTNVLELFASSYLPSCFSNIASICELNYSFEIYGDQTDNLIDESIIDSWMKSNNKSKFG